MMKKRISSSLTELESSLDQVIGTIDSDLAGKFSNSVKEGVGRKKLELNALQEFCKTKYYPYIKVASLVPICF